MLNISLAGDHQYGKMRFTWLSLVMSLVVSFLVLSLSHEMSWMRSGTELRQFLRIFLPTLYPRFFSCIYDSSFGNDTVIKHAP